MSREEVRSQGSSAGAAARHTARPIINPIHKHRPGEKETPMKEVADEFASRDARGIDTTRLDTASMANDIVVFRRGTNSYHTNRATYDRGGE